MNHLEKTQTGFTVSRRCDVCGQRAVIAFESGNRCVLKCTGCGREYEFFLDLDMTPAPTRILGL